MVLRADRMSSGKEPRGKLTGKERERGEAGQDRTDGRNKGSERRRRKTTEYSQFPVSAALSWSRFQKEMWLFCAEPEMNIQEVGKITS